jgi:hypothetical protein
MEVNGAAVLSLPLFIKAEHGEEAFQRWLDSLPEQARNVFSTPIFQSAWYPMKEILVEPTKKICELFYGGDLKGAWDCGRYSADHGLRGIYKIFVRLSSPEFLINKASIILPTYYRPSKMKVIENAKGHAIVRVIEFPEMDKVIELRMAGWMERALEISGCKDVHMKLICSLTEGAPYTEFEGSWS